jgi:hypothetical protein
MPVANDAATLDAALKQARAGRHVFVLAEGEWRDVVIRCKAEGTAQARPSPCGRRCRARPMLHRQPRACGWAGATSWSRACGSAIQTLQVGDTDGVPAGLQAPRANIAGSASAPSPWIPARSARDAKESRWLGLYGGHNRHRPLPHLAGKVTKGASAVVWLGEGPGRTRHQHRPQPLRPARAPGQEWRRDDPRRRQQDLHDRGRLRDRGQPVRALQRRGRVRLQQVLRQHLPPQRLPRGQRRPHPAPWQRLPRGGQPLPGRQRRLRHRRHAHHRRGSRRARQPPARTSRATTRAAA